MSDLLRPQDLKKITLDTEMAKAQAATGQMEREEQESRALHEAFMSRDVHPEVKQRINAAVASAAGRGANELMVLSFPASYCNDHGRRINNAEADWPDSLEGFAKAAMLYYEKELRPLGYRVEARVMDFPGGMPGTVGMFLRW